VLDHATRIDVAESRQRLAMTFFREPDVRLECFLHDPASGPIQAVGEAIDRLARSAGTWAVTTRLLTGNPPESS